MKVPLRACFLTDLLKVGIITLSMTNMMENTYTDPHFVQTNRGNQENSLDHFGF